MKLLSAKLQASNRVVLTFDRNPGNVPVTKFSFAPKVRIVAYEQLENIIVLLTDPVDISSPLSVFVKGIGHLPVLPDKIFEEFHSRKKLGCTAVAGSIAFRVFAPRATRVELCMYESLDTDYGDTYEMTRDDEGVWEIALSKDITDRYYCYRVFGPKLGEERGELPPAVPDPYATHIEAKNSYLREARAVIMRSEEPFDWGDDKPVVIHPRDLMIYETHLRDLTAHSSSGAKAPGSYAGFIETEARGGLNHIASLGVNAVEFLPLQHFASVEPPFQTKTKEGWYNAWNPYERNHWGYMPASYFTPEPRYASNADLRKGSWCNTGGREVTEFKNVVKALHGKGIAVIMDVVYNHTSEYDLQPFKLIDPLYYYHTNADGTFTALSGCGNDFHTSRPMSRRVIVDSIAHWMREYHVDGFRFDLATMIDQETFEQIRSEARKINPHVVLIAEPWGGGQRDIERFSEFGMGAWNDVFRDGIKGTHPQLSQGFLFGTWGSNPPDAYGKWVLGSIRKKNGPFLDAAHSVNYLASHDGYTLGDFIRMALDEAQEHQPVSEAVRMSHLTPAALQLNKLAAFLLFTCQGTVMMHEGQEFARSKVIASSNIPHTSPGILDANSYEKDDATNWLDYDAMERNRELMDYYRGMIAVRNEHRSLRWAQADRYSFLETKTPIASGFILDDPDCDSLIAVLANAHRTQEAEYSLLSATWSVLVDGRTAGIELRETQSTDRFIVPPSTGVLLVAKREKE